MGKKTQLDGYLTAKEYAKANRVHYETVRRWIREGKIQAVDVYPESKRHYWRIPKRHPLPEKPLPAPKPSGRRLLDEHLTTGEYAKLNRVHPQWVLKHIWNGEIPAVRLNDVKHSDWRIPKSVLKRPPKAVQRLRQRRRLARERQRETGTRR